MYNLLIHGREGFWDRSPVAFPSERYLEHTTPVLAERYPLDADGLRAATKNLALVGYEKGMDQPFRLAWIEDAQVVGDGITLNRRLVSDLSSISPELVLRARPALGFGKQEEFRTHWAIKDVDLVAVLAAIGAVDDRTAQRLNVESMIRRDDALKVESGQVIYRGSIGAGTKAAAAALRQTVVDVNPEGGEPSVASAEPETVKPPPQTILVKGITNALEERLKKPRVFIVHGRDELLKNEVARYLEKIGLEAIILHEQPNRGKTIIQKFEDAAQDIAFAVVLITPDDIGGLKGEEVQSDRARQNVILELGYFLGRFGKHKVCALVKGKPEMPSDVLAVTYVEANTEAWKLGLARELDAAGVPFEGAIY